MTDNDIHVIGEGVTKEFLQYMVEECTRKMNLYQNEVDFDDTLTGRDITNHFNMIEHLRIVRSTYRDLIALMERKGL